MELNTPADLLNQMEDKDIIVDFDGSQRKPEHILQR